jgi:hypothetical protein
VTVLRDGAKVGTFAGATIDGRKLSHRCGCTRSPGPWPRW